MPSGDSFQGGASFEETDCRLNIVGRQVFGVVAHELVEYWQPLPD